jgi:hypothetical protein
VRYRHPELGFELALPDGSELHDDMDGMAIVAVEPNEPSSGFRANLVVTVEEVGVGTSVQSYTEVSLRSQGELLFGHRLIDLEPLTIDARPATRTLAHHAQEHRAITIEQWRVVEGTHAYTVTCSCATLDYATVADGFREAAESLVLDGPR